jgi:hypothetical protein
LRMIRMRKVIQAIGSAAEWGRGIRVGLLRL